MNKRFKNNLLISLSFLLCFLIDSLPFSLQLNEIKPSLLLLSLIYWNLALPERIGIGFSLSLGILYDFLQGTLLGIYPLIFIFTSYLCQRFFYQIRPMRFFQQSPLGSTRSVTGGTKEFSWRSPLASVFLAKFS